MSTLRRTADAIFEKGGIIRKLENLGTKPTPYKISAHGLVHRQASYFLIEFDTPPKHIADLNEFYGRDIDIIRRRVYKLPDPLEVTKVECTLHDEIQPPAYRREVQEMIEKGKKDAQYSFSKPFKYNTGLDYYPFQK